MIYFLRQMLLLCILSLSLLSLVNYTLARKVLYPPVILCAVWAADLAVVWLSGDLFYPVSTQTLLVFEMGCWAFSGGAALALLLPQTSRTPQYDLKTSNRLINLLLLTVILSVPFIYRWVSSIAADFDSSNLLVGSYLAMTAGVGKYENYYLFLSLIMLGNLVAILCVCERQDHGKRAFLACLVATVIQLITGLRSAFAIVMLSIIGVEWVRSGKLRLKFLIPVATVLILFMSVLSVLVPKTDARRDTEILEMMAPVGRGLVLYAAGGIPAFSQVVEDPNIIPHDWQATAFFQPWINRLGGHLELSHHAQFLAIGPGGLQQNVYTIYFAYIDYGYTGIILLMGAIGFVVALVHRRACSGHRIAVLLYGFFFAAMVLSPYSDYFFFVGLPFSTKLWMVSWVVFSLPIRWRNLIASKPSLIGKISDPI